jgi:DNA polymerase sigma
MANDNGLPSLLRDDEVAEYEEESVRFEEQAVRNAAMRDRLLARKRVRDESQKDKPIEERFLAEKLAPEAFMEVISEKKKAVVNESQPPWFVARPQIDNTILRLHEELLDFSGFMGHSRGEVKARRAWVQTIANVCRGMWPACRVRVFGSFFTGLSLPNGDVDMAVLDVPVKPATAMKLVCEHLLSAGEISWLEIIESAKVPVAKVRSQACGLRADIVFNQPDGMETSKFIRDRMKEYPQMKPLLVFLKYFLMQRGLHETFGGGMGSYLMCNVVLHFLQRHPSRRDERQYKSTSLGHLLFDFLKYYGQEFRYDQKGISVLAGGHVFDRSEMKGKGKGKKGKGPSLCLKSPSNEDLDLGGACFRMSVIKNLFHHGFHCLCHLMVSRSPPDVSMICPLLLDPAHPVIVDRHVLLREQPLALPGLPRAADNKAVESVDAEIFGDADIAALDDEESRSADAAQGAPAAKRARQEVEQSTAEGSPSPATGAEGEQPEGDVQDWVED